MKLTNKLIYVSYTNNYFPELFALTYPSIYAYSQRINADLIIDTRISCPEYHIHYEKLKIREFLQDYDYAFLLDADILIHPKFPDFSGILRDDSWLSINDTYDFHSKFKPNSYTINDGRNVGMASNAIIVAKQNFRIFEDIDITPAEAKEVCLVRPGDIDEYVLSYNLAKYKIPYHGITWELWQRYYFVHIGTGDRIESLRLAKEVLANWKQRDGVEFSS